MNPDQPIARLRPGGRGDHLAARTRLVADAQPPTPTHGGGETGDSPHTQQADTLALREWHALTADAADTVWQELVDWVVWLYDRYELATEHRLPDCWAEHPGLIEELSALRAWRIQIYDAEQPSGQAARYWHAELRQVVQAAGSFYAKGCRAGHRAPTEHAATDHTLRARWLAGNPLAAIPSALLAAAPADHSDDSETAPEEETRVISAEQMRAAIDAGHAHPVGALVPDYQHYQGTWWTVTDDAEGWQEITDPVFTAGLDAAAQRLRLADEIAEKHRTSAPDRPPADQPATDRSQTDPHLTDPQVTDPHGDDQ